MGDGGFSVAEQPLLGRRAGAGAVAAIVDGDDVEAPPRERDQDIAPQRQVAAIAMEVNHLRSRVALRKMPGTEPLAVGSRDGE